MFRGQMSKPTIADLIVKATQDGYDVAVIVRKKDGAGRGHLTLPPEWLAVLAVEPARFVASCKD